MKKENLISLVLLVFIIVIIFLIVLLSGSDQKDIEVNVLNVSYENNHYIVNVSLKNNQDEAGWISDTYLETIKGSIIHLTGAGIDKKVNNGETEYIRLFSAEITESITDSPFTLMYTAFPSGKSYSVEI